MREEFGPLLRMFRERAGRSRHGMCVEAAIDPSYGVRLEYGDRVPPRIGIVESLARTLRLSPQDRNRLLVAAGYVPHEINLNGWSDTLQAVADVLCDPMLSTEERDAFEATVRNIAIRWRPKVLDPTATNGAHEPAAPR